MRPAEAATFNASSKVSDGIFYPTKVKALLKKRMKDTEKSNEDEIS